MVQTSREISMPAQRMLLILGLCAFSRFLAPAVALAQPYTVTFVLDLRQEIAAGRFDPAHDKVGVRGGVSPLDWNVTLAASDPGGEGRYEVTITFPKAPFGGQAVAYKYKVDHPAGGNTGWEDGRNRQLFLKEPAQTVSRVFNEPPPPVVLSRVGTIRVHPAFPSKLLAPRDVQVYLPPGYDLEPRRRYPVLYLHDGQNVFDAEHAGMEWQVDETAEALIKAGRIEPVLIVAVSSTDAREDEYTPSHVHWKEPDGEAREAGGKADLYGRFLIEELKPFIDRTYRTRRGAASTALGGASFGGLDSLYQGLRHPQVFGGVLAVSPSAWWDDDLIVKQVAALPRKTAQRIWVDIGSLEGEESIAATRRLRDALVRKGWKLGTNLEYLEQEGAHHDEVSWASRVEGMLVFLYGRRGKI
jgi:predicted alpha/beta superfamily hydrolase